MLARSDVYKPISILASQQLRSLVTLIETTLIRCDDEMDAYTSAHLTESKERIEQALIASYIYNAGGQQVPMMMLFGKQPQVPVQQ
jgi:hypothetical protein